MCGKNGLVERSKHVNQMLDDLSYFSQGTLCFAYESKNKNLRSRRYRPLSRGGHFESQGNKNLCFCPSSLALDERLDGQNLLFQHCVIKVYCKRTRNKKMAAVRINTAIRIYNKFFKLSSLFTTQVFYNQLCGEVWNAVWLFPGWHRKACFLCSLHLKESTFLSRPERMNRTSSTALIIFLPQDSTR